MSYDVPLQGMGPVLFTIAQTYCQAWDGVLGRNLTHATPPWRRLVAPYLRPGFFFLATRYNLGVSR